MLFGGEVVQVDDEDFEGLTTHKWSCLRGKGATYYACSCKRVNGYQKTVLMHRVIVNCPEGMQVDHINGNGLDNQKHNLRICTDHQNKRARKQHFKSKSGYKGVSWDNWSQKWRAQIRINDTNTHIGRYDTKEAAAHAYDNMARIHFGEFAHLNFGETATDEDIR